MSENLTGDLRESSYSGLAGTFRRLGWIGFWTQVVVGAFPVLLLAYLFLFAGSPTGPRAGLRFVEYLALLALFILLFTTYWSYGYTRISNKIIDSDRRPTDASLSRATWIGIMVSTIGILVSIVVMLIEVAHLLYYFLKTPQAGVPVIQATAEASWVSAIDMLSLLALTLSLLAEVIVLVLSLWLLFRVSIVTAKPLVSAE
jgi:hypothetical protein